MHFEPASTLHANEVSMNEEAIMPDDLLKAGEFAHLCGTTKETLRHYKDIGLLMPVAKAENGYQLYSPLQISDYLLISSLQQAGCSLQEIKGYLSEPDSEALENVMEDRISAIVEQRRTLLMQKSLLKNTLARMRARNDWRHDPAEFKLETYEAEYFLDSNISDAFVSVAEANLPALIDEQLALPTEKATAVLQDESAHASDRKPKRTVYSAQDGVQVDEQAERVVRHILDVWRLGQKQGDVSELQGNYRVGLEAFLKCTRVRPHKRRKGLVEKPAGTYFKYLRTMNFAEVKDELEPAMELFGIYEKMRRVLEREGFTPTSDVFERELSLYTGNSDEIIFSELSVRIDR